MNPKKHHIVIFVIILLIIAALFYFFKTPKTIAPETNQVATTTSDSFTYTTKTISEENKDKHYTIKAIYPVFSLKNADAQKNLNDNVALVVQDEVSAFKTSFEEIAASDAKEESTFTMTFIVTANQNLKNIMPIKFSEDYYNAGAAHPGSLVVTTNYDLSTGAPISLVSLFRPGSRYLETLSSYSIDVLKDRFGPDANADFINDGASPKEQNFEAFLITDQGLVIIFNEYQVAPYAAGIQELTVPYSALKNILNPNGSLRSKINS